MGHPGTDSAASENGAPSNVRIAREIGDTSYGARLFEVEAGGLRLGFITYAKKAAETRGLEAPLNAVGKRFAIVVARFNSFITQRLLDGALQALRQCGANPDDITIVNVPGSFEIPSAARQLAETKRFHAIVCIGCLLRGDTLHYDVIANETTRGVGQSAQETGVPHAFGVLTCDTLEQAIDRAGLKAGNKGFEAGLAAVEMASLRDKVAKASRQRRAKTASPNRLERDCRKVIPPARTAASEQVRNPAQVARADAANAVSARHGQAKRRSGASDLLARAQRS